VLPATVFPLFTVVFISMIKDIFEDLKRHQNDRKENSKKVLLGSHLTGEFTPQLWESLTVGSIVKVNRDEPFPADLILLNSSLPKGLCFIETKDLDGETNLKHKISEKKLLTMDMNTDSEVLTSMKGAFVECENPNEMLYRFEGTVYVRDIVAPLCVDQSLLRGSVLKNTDYIYGLVVYTGHDTKVF
jgi:P-type E1-E2 ATPase